MLPIYIINLSRAKTRREAMISQFKESIFTPSVIEAIDGHSTDFPYRKYKDLLVNKERELHYSQIACHLSHLKAWKTILKNQDEAAIILEDDASVDFPRLEKFLETEISHMPADTDVLYINARSLRWLNRYTAAKFAAEGRHLDRKNKSELTRKLRKHFNLLFYYRLMPRLLPQEVWEGDFIGVGEALLHRIKNGDYSGIVQNQGLDGYLVTQQGAEKLVQIAKAFRCDYTSDGAVEVHSLSLKQQAEIRNWPKAKWPKHFDGHFERENELIAKGIRPNLALNSYILKNGPLTALNEHSKLSTIGRDLTSATA